MELNKTANRMTRFLRTTQSAMGTNAARQLPVRCMKHSVSINKQASVYSSVVDALRKSTGVLRQQASSLTSGAEGVVGDAVKALSKKLPGAMRDGASRVLSNVDATQAGKSLLLHPRRAATAAKLWMNGPTGGLGQVSGHVWSGVNRPGAQAGLLERLVDALSLPALVGDFSKLPARSRAGLPEAAQAKLMWDGIKSGGASDGSPFANALSAIRRAAERDSRVDPEAAARHLMAGMPRIGVFEKVPNDVRARFQEWYEKSKLMHDDYTSRPGGLVRGWWDNPNGRLLHQVGDDGYLAGLDIDPFFMATHIAPSGGYKMATYRMIKRLLGYKAPVLLPVPADIAGQLAKGGWQDAGGIVVPHADTMVTKRLMVNPAGGAYRNALYDNLARAGVPVVYDR